MIPKAKPEMANALPKHIFDLMKRIDEDTMKFYDGAYLDTKTSTNVYEISEVFCGLSRHRDYHIK